MLNLGRYGKAIVAAITAGIGWGQLVITSPSSSITANEWMLLVTAIATALGVYVVSNAPASG